MGDLTKNTFSRKKKNKRQAYGNQTLIRLKETLHVECGVLKDKVQRSARNDKRRYLHSLARVVEAAIQHKNKREFIGSQSICGGHWTAKAPISGA